MRILAITNRKGGVGKTTTAVNVSEGLAARGQRVLLIDLDTQHNASVALGFRLNVREPSPVYRVLASAHRVVDHAIPTGFGFDLLAAHCDVDDAVDKMRRAIGGRGRLVLREALDEVPRDRWDTVVLDCPPSVGDITNAALIAAHAAIIPMVLQPLPLEGLTEVMELISVVRASDNPRLQIAAVFPTLIDDNTKLASVVRGQVEELLGTEMLPVRVRRNNALAEAQAAGKPIRAYKPDCNGATDYGALVDAMIERGAA